VNPARNTDLRSLLTTVRAPKSALVAALTAAGLERDGRKDRFLMSDGSAIVIYKRGTTCTAGPSRTVATSKRGADTRRASCRCNVSSRAPTSAAR
jgi:hypothetical protein